MSSSASILEQSAATVPFVTFFFVVVMTELAASLYSKLNTAVLI